MNNYFITWFYSEQSDNESYYPSVGGKTSSTKFQDVYWKCIYDLYKSAYITDKDTINEYLFFSNINYLPVVDGVDFNVFFDELGITVIKLDLTKKTKQDWHGAWRNQFYLFDILQYLEREYKTGNFLILDSDCLIRKDLQSIYFDIKKYRNVTYTIGYKPSQSINGLTTEEMRKLYVKFYGDNNNIENLNYIGGEFIGISANILNEVLSEFHKIWNENFILYEQQSLKLNEEAHFLSVIFFRLSYANEYGNKYIKRMWTALKCDNIEPADMGLPIWHLPAEKKFGFSVLFESIKYKEKVTEQELKFLGEYIMCIPKPLNLRRLKRAYNSIMDRVKNKFQINLENKTII